MMLPTILVAASFCGVIAWQQQENRRGDMLARSIRQEKQAAVNKLVTLKGASLETLAYDYTYWDEMARFVKTADKKWAVINLNSALSSYKVTGIWVYDKRCALVYSVTGSQDARLKALPLPPAILRALLGGTRFCHLFLKTPAGLLEVRGATIHKSADEKRLGPYYGYFFTGRLWDKDYLAEIAGLTNCSVQLLPVLPAGASLRGSQDRNGFEYSLLFPGWDKKPLARLRFSQGIPILWQLNRATRHVLTLFIGFAVLLLGLLFVCLYRWVNRPLRVIFACLQTHDTTLLAHLEKEKNEYADLAWLMRAFFEQKSALELEVSERQRAEAALREARDELEVRVQQRTVALAAANASLQAEITERKRGETEILRLNAHLESRLRRIAALRQIDIAITSSLDLRLTLSIVLDQTVAQLGIDAATVLLCNRQTQTLTYAADKGFRGPTPRDVRLPMDQGLAGQAIRQGQIVHIANLSAVDGSILRPALLETEGFVAYFAVPLIAKGQVEGVLELFHRAPLEPDEEWLAFFEALAGQAAIAIDNASLFEVLQRSNQELTVAYDATIEGWSRALELRDKETEGHSQRVTQMTLRLARALNMSEEEMISVRRGALLHDIGKMGVPDSILLKPGALTEEERAIMCLHTVYAYEMLAPITFLRQAIDIPYCHHERWDGKGYPRGLKGEEIPLAARLFAVVDIWDALSSNRPYRQAWPSEKVREHLRSLAGNHLDPQAVELFLRVTAEDRAQSQEVILKAA